MKLQRPITLTSLLVIISCFFFSGAVLGQDPGSWNCDDPAAISAVEEQVQDTIVHMIERSLDQQRKQMDQQTRDQLGQHLEQIKGQMDVRIETETIKPLDEHSNFRGCQARLKLGIRRQTRRMPINYVIHRSNGKNQVEVQWPEELSRYNNDNRRNVNCQSKVSQAKSEISTIRTAIVQCDMNNDCSKTKLDHSNYGDFLTKSHIQHYNFALEGGNIHSITREDIGCEWSDDHGNRGSGMAYVINDGKFLAYSGDFQPNSGSNDRKNTPTEMVNGEDSITFENLRVVSQSDHQVKLKVDYAYQDKSIGRAYINVSAVANGRRIWNGFESNGSSITPPSGTASVELRYRTLNPQWDKQDPPATIETNRIAVRALGQNIDTIEERFPLKKTWHLHQPYKPSEDIPDDPSVNEIKVTSVEKVDSTTRQVHYTYDYRSDHGPKVHMSASALKDGQDVSCCTHVDELQRGRHTNTTKFSRRISEIRSHPVTNQLELTMTIGISETNIFSKTIDHRIDWSDALDQTSDVYTTSRNASQSDNTALSVLIDAMRRYDRLDDIPDDYVDDYLERAGTKNQFEQLLNLYLNKHRDQLKHSPTAFTRILEILNEADKQLSVSRNWTKRQVKRLFRKHRTNQPLYNGPFTETMFNHTKQLLDGIRGKSMSDLAVSNFYSHQPEHPTIQIPDHLTGPESLVNTVFIRVPDSTYVESIHVDRLLDGVSDRVYKALFTQGFGRHHRAGHRYYMESGQRSQDLVSNSFRTENYWVPIQRSNVEWIRLSIPSLQQPTVSHEITVHSIPHRTLRSRRKLRTGALSKYFDGLSENLLSWAENVEKARAMNYFDRWSPPDRSGTGFQILTGAFHLMAGKHDKANQHLANLRYPDRSQHRKWLQMYGLLPLVDLSWDDFLEYRATTPIKRVRLLRKRNLSVPGQYSLARELWQAGSFEKASKQFEQLLEMLEPGEVLWDEAKLYHISSLYRRGDRQSAIEALSTYLYRTSRLRSTNRKPFVIEVEGIFTNGLPMRNYLIQWLDAMKNGRRAWWYEKIGTSEEPIRYYRYFSTEFEREPIGHLAANAFLEETNSSAGYINHKGMRGEIDKGPIRRNELFLILPWNNRIHTFMMERPTEVSRGAIQRKIDAIPRPPNPVTGRGPGSNYYTGSLEVQSVVNRFLEREDAIDQLPLISMPEFLSRMAERTSSTFENATVRREPLTDREMLEQYIEEHSPIRSPEVRDQ